VRFDPERETPPYYEIRKRLDERLATRDLVRDPATKRLQVMNMLIRAQVGVTDRGISSADSSAERFRWF
jgi:hypothetical protein